MRRALATLAALTLATLAGCGTVPTMGTPAPAYVACVEEDGSGTQSFPCMWDASSRGNGQGESYVLTMPACTPYESALAAESIERGETLRLACDDLWSIVGAN